MSQDDTPITSPATPDATAVAAPAPRVPEGPLAVVPDLSTFADPLAAGVPLRQRLERLWRLATTAVDLRAAAIMAFAGGWLVFTQIHTTTGAYDRDFKGLLGDLPGYLKPAMGHLYWFWMGPIVLFLVPLLVGRLVLGMRPAELGAQVGNWRSGLKWVFGIYACFLPVVVTVSFFGAFKKMYPLNHWVGDEAFKAITNQGGSLWPFLLFEVSYGLYFIGWEFFFRGFLGFGLFKSLGYYSVFVATIPFAVMHVGKPEPEALGSVVAGIFLGFFALKERSFLYGALLHALVAWTMDLLAITHRVLEHTPQMTQTTPETAAPVTPENVVPAPAPAPTPPAPPRVARPILVSLGVLGAMTLPVLGLGALGLINVEMDALVSTAAPTLCTAWMMLLGACLAGAARGKRNVIHLCMGAALTALLVVGFPLFVALEPIPWRFAVGLVGPALLVAALAYGAPVAVRAREPRVATVVRAWVFEPLRLVVSVLRSLTGRDDAARTGGAAHG